MVPLAQFCYAEVKSSKRGLKQEIPEVYSWKIPRIPQFFGCPKDLPPGRIGRNSLCLAKRGHFEIKGSGSGVVPPAGVFSDGESVSDDTGTGNGADGIA